MPEEKGLLIVYTGPGKGKTTCALGTAFRAVGQGLRVLMVQFIKGSWHYGELDAAKMLGDEKFEIRPMGRGFVKIGGAETDPADIKLAQECWQAGRDAHPKLTELAALVTEMREVKHPYTKGILAQRGVDY